MTHFKNKYDCSCGKAERVHNTDMTTKTKKSQVKQIEKEIEAIEAAIVALEAKLK